VTVLETMRALRAGPPLRNNVIAAFTDGEEVGDLGAAAFMQTHRWANDVRLALNFEGWAPGGQTMLYIASANDAALLSEFFGSAPAPVGSSFFRALATLEPASGMDLEEYTWRGRDGLGFFFVNLDHAAYHTVGDNPGVIDPRSIQDNGSIAVAAVRDFGDLDLAALPHEGDAVTSAWFQG
jgi:Zn-dependent M28 family amino/carboxypeptidase